MACAASSAAAALLSDVVAGSGAPVLVALAEVALEASPVPEAGSFRSAHDAAAGAAQLQASLLARAALSAAATTDEARRGALAAVCAERAVAICSAAGSSDADFEAAVPTATLLAASHLFAGLAALLAAGDATAAATDALAGADLASLLQAATGLLLRLPRRGTRAPLGAAAGLPLLAFAEAAGAALAAGGGAPGGFEAALGACLALVDGLGSPLAPPRLPPAHWTVEDLAAVAEAAAAAADVGSGAGAGAAALLPRGPGEGAQEALLQQGALLALRRAVGAARRSHLLELHRALSRRLAARAGAGAPRALRGALQALLVALEAAGGGQALRQLAHHAAAYAATLSTAVTLTAARPDVAAALRPAAGDAGVNAGAATAASEDCVWALSALSWALRCLESIAGREASLELHACAVADAAQAAADVLGGGPGVMARATAMTAAAADGSGGGVARAEAVAAAAAAAAFASACALLASLLRHRARDLRRAMAPVVAGARGALALLSMWLARGGSGGGGSGGGSGEAAAAWRAAAERGAEQLARVYAAVADQGALLGRYCHLLLADYVIWAAANAAAEAAAAGGTSSGGAPGAAAAARAASAAALRRGALALFGATPPGELQHVHAAAAAGAGAAAPARRAALAALRAAYEGEFKWRGKA